MRHAHLIALFAFIGCAEKAADDVVSSPAPVAAEPSDAGSDPNQSVPSQPTPKPKPDAMELASDGAVMVRPKKCDDPVAIVRDFSTSHPDMQRDGCGVTVPLCVECAAASVGNPHCKGIIKPQLENGYPAYAHAGETAYNAGPKEFYQWYVDTPGVNHRFEVPIPLTEISPGRYVYENNLFFPIDGKGFGNEGNAHNYHFTTELRTRFTYKGGEEFTFRGDDDLWMFVNGVLAIDLGGLHTPATSTVNMDEIATKAGLTKGETYSMDIFHAERHTVDSNFRIETTIECFEVVEPPPPPPPII